MEEVGVHSQKKKELQVQNIKQEANKSNGEDKQGVKATDKGVVPLTGQAHVYNTCTHQHNKLQSFDLPFASAASIAPTVVLSGQTLTF